MTTWKEAWYWPKLPASAVEMALPKKEHLMRVTLAGEEQVSSRFSREESRSKSGMGFLVFCVLRFSQGGQ